jgi:hypothetical protein
VPQGQTACRFRQTLAEQTVTLERIAEARIMIEQSRLLTLKAAHMMDTVGNKAARQRDRDDQGDRAEYGQKIVDWAIKAFGGGGTRTTTSWRRRSPRPALASGGRTGRSSPQSIGRLEIRRYQNTDPSRTGGGDPVVRRRRPGRGWAMAEPQGSTTNASGEPSRSEALRLSWRALVLHGQARGAVFPSPRIAGSRSLCRRLSDSPITWRASTASIFRLHLPPNFFKEIQRGNGSFIGPFLLRPMSAIRDDLVAKVWHLLRKILRDLDRQHHDVVIACNECGWHFDMCTTPGAISLPCESAAR